MTEVGSGAGKGVGTEVGAIAIREATSADVPQILAFIQALAVYEREPDAVLATNTSTIQITKLAEGMKNPERFCGIHFFNPVRKMLLVEVIRRERRSAPTVSRSLYRSGSFSKSCLVGVSMTRNTHPHTKRHRYCLLHPFDTISAIWPSMALSPSVDSLALPTCSWSGVAGYSLLRDFVSGSYHFPRTSAAHLF